MSEVNLQCGPARFLSAVSATVGHSRSITRCDRAVMRGKLEQKSAMFTSLSIEDLIAQDHPIHRIRRVVDGVLAGMDGEFDAMYSTTGRPSVSPGQLL